MAKSDAIDRLRNIAHCVNCFHCRYKSHSDIICHMDEWGIIVNKKALQDESRMVQVSFEELVSNLKFAEIAYNCKYYQTMED